MRDPIPVRRNSLGALLVCTALAGIVGCAPRLVLNPAIASAGAESSTGDSTKAYERPHVELRYWWFSPTVSVFSWMPDDANYGLVARVRRDGSVIRDHRLFVSTYYMADVRAFPRAAVPAKSRPLKMTGISRDIYNCRFSDTCSPYETFGARIPDELLRSNRDSVAVRFYDRAGRELTLTVHRELIDAYLAAVDSLSAALRKRG